jgi:putative transposase
MPRRVRGETAGRVYHVMNRAVRRAPLFDSHEDYQTYEHVLWEALQRVPIRLLADSAMPNHWHLVVWPDEDDQLSRFMHWLTMTHAQRWHKAHRTAGTGPVYQDRFRAVPITCERHAVWACRYVERNALAAGLVPRAEEWRWSSLWRRCHHVAWPTISEWPAPRPDDWVDYVNRPHTAAEAAAVDSLRGVRRGRGRPRKAGA